MGFLRRLLGRHETDPGVSAPLPLPSDEERAGIPYTELLRQLASSSEKTRHDMAMLLSALGHRGAIRPLIGAYMTYGDPAVLHALAAFGPKVTMVAARDVRDMSLAPSQRARLLEVLGATGDPGAIALVLPLAEDSDSRVHVAACGALARLGDPRGIDRLADDLLRLDPGLRARSLAELQSLDVPAADAAIEDYVRRYLSAGGAVPTRVTVSLPLLLDRTADLIALMGDHVGVSPHNLTVVTGPATDSISEGQRDGLASQLPDHRILFVTPRHSPEERTSLLASARQLAASGGPKRVAIVGHLPSPESARPVANFLTREAAGEYSARIVLIGPKRFAAVMEWWRYIGDQALVPTDLGIVLTNLVFGGGDLSAEELALYHLAGEARRDEFARAFLAQL